MVYCSWHALKSSQEWVNTALVMEMLAYSPTTLCLFDTLIAPSNLQGSISSDILFTDTQVQSSLSIVCIDRQKLTLYSCKRNPSDCSEWLKYTAHDLKNIIKTQEICMRLWDFKLDLHRGRKTKDIQTLLYYIHIITKIPARSQGGSIAQVVYTVYTYAQAHTRTSTHTHTHTLTHTLHLSFRFDSQGFLDSFIVSSIKVIRETTLFYGPRI